MEETCSMIQADLYAGVTGGTPNVKIGWNSVSVSERRGGEEARSLGLVTHNNRIPYHSISLHANMR